MLITKPRFQTFAEYLQYEDNSEELYELFNGELVEMPPESGFNYQIANRLFFVFALMLGTDRVRGHGLELETRGEPKNHYSRRTYSITLQKKYHSSYHAIPFISNRSR